MPGMTDEEADNLDEYYTKNTIMPVPDKPGFFARQKAAHIVSIDELTAGYLIAKAIAVRKTPSEIIGDLVRREMSAAVESK
jgi:hypothetical protein